MTDQTVTSGTTETKKARIKTWTQQAFSKKLNLATVLAAAARAEYVDPLARRGIDEASIARVEELIRLATDANNRQEVLKGALKQATAEIDTYMVELSKKYSEIKKTVKLAVAKPEWKKFGFDDGV